MKTRRFNESDIPYRVEWMNDPRIYSFMHFDVPISLERTRSWYKTNIDNPNRVDLVFENDAGERVAMGVLTAINYKLGKAEFYIFVNPFLISKGIGTSATILICKYAFEILGLDKVYLYVNESNKRACWVYRNVGFQREGVFRNERIHDHHENLLYYEMLADELNMKEELIFIG